MMVTDEEYQKNSVFADLERYSAFYESLAHSVFGFVSEEMGSKKWGQVRS